MKRLRLLAAAATLAGLLATGTARAEEYSVLVLQSLTGALGFVGVPARDGMLLAVDDINAQHLLGPGNTLKAVVEDDGTDRGQALSMIGRYALDPKVLAIIGPTTASVAIPGVQAANEKKIAAMAMTNSPDIAKAGPYAFRQTQSANYVIDVIARYAVDRLHIKSCVVIGASDSAAYVEQAQEFQDYITAHGAKLMARENIKLSDTDFAALATKVVAMNPECIYFSATAPVAGNLMVQLRQAGLDPATKITGMGSMASPDLIKSGGKAVEGLYLIADWAPGGSSDYGRAFDAEFRQRFGNEPDNFNAMGYAGMRTVAAALKQAIDASGGHPTRDQVRDALANLKDVPTILGAGRISYDADRAPHYGMNVLVVKDGKFVLAE